VDCRKFKADVLFKVLKQDVKPIDKIRSGSIV
jgi:hypothetical protein